jgi:hypothetical protein
MLSLFFLRNSQPVSCQAEITLSSNEFFISENFVEILPHSEKEIHLIFHPHALSKYCSRCQIFVQQSYNKCKVFSFRLEGSCTLPLISLANQSKNSVSFGKILINSRYQQNFEIINSCKILTLYILQSNSSSDFFISSHEI